MVFVFWYVVAQHFLLLYQGQRIGHMQSAKPRVLIYNKELADSHKQDVDSDWLVIATDKVTGKPLRHRNFLIGCFSLDVY